MTTETKTSTSAQTPQNNTVEETFSEQNNPHHVNCTHTEKANNTLFKLNITETPPYRNYVSEKKSEFENLLEEHYSTFQEVDPDSDNDENTFYYLI